MCTYNRINKRFLDQVKRGYNSTFPWNFLSNFHLFRIGSTPETWISRQHYTLFLFPSRIYSPHLQTNKVRLQLSLTLSERERETVRISRVHAYKPLELRVRNIHYVRIKFPNCFLGYYQEIKSTISRHSLSNRTFNPRRFKHKHFRVPSRRNLISCCSPQRFEG